MFKKSTSTSRICENRLTPKSIIYSTKSHGRRENFEIYDRTYNRAIKKLWVKLVIEIGQGRSVKSLNEWEKMLIQKFGKLNYEKA